MASTRLFHALALPLAFAFLLSAAAPAALSNLADVGSVVPGLRIEGAVSDSNTGDSAAFVGDFNGDGFDDVLIGASGDPGSSPGHAYLVFGSQVSPSTVNLGSLGSKGVKFTGVAIGDEAGFSVASGGDFNGDGIDDILIGAPGADPLGREDAGEAYLIFGRIAPPQAISLADVGTPSVPGVRLVGRSEGDAAGSSVSFAGDMDGDGRTDIAVGAPLGDSNGSTLGGEVYLLYGSETLTGTVDPTTSLVRGIVLESHETNRLAGSSVSTGGDLNGDGLDDLVVGAPGALGSGLPGKVYIICGCQFLTTPTNLDEVGAGVTGVTYVGSPGDFAGRVVAYAGDINGDGFDELLVGAPNNGPGHAYLIGGQEFVRSPFLLSDIASTEREYGLILSGATDGDHAGGSVFAGGDVTGDGLDDLLVGAPLADVSPEVDVGLAYRINGFSTPLPASRTVQLANVGGTVPGVTWRGAGASHMAGDAVGGRGDFNGDGIEDSLIGASGADFGSGPTGGAYVIFGSDLSSTAPSYVRHIRAGDAIPRRFPPVRLVVDLASGETPDPAPPGVPPDVSVERVTLFRSAPTGLPGDLQAVLPVHWEYLSRYRTDSTGASVLLKYTVDEIGSLPDTNIRVFTGPSASGPWTEAPNQSVDSRRRRVQVDDLTFDDNVPVFFALGVTANAMITAFDMANVLLGYPVSPELTGQTDPNGDTVEDVGDVVDLVNKGL